MAINQKNYRQGPDPVAMGYDAWAESMGYGSQKGGGFLGLGRNAEVERLYNQAIDKYQQSQGIQDSWISMLDENGKLKQEFEIGNSTPTGPSDWANYLLQQQQLNQTGIVDDINASQASEAASGWNQLAMRGGAGASERERLVSAAARGAREARQRANLQNAQTRLGILGKDEDRKLDIEKTNLATRVGAVNEKNTALAADATARGQLRY